MEINSNNDLIKLFQNANSIDYNIYESEMSEHVKLSKSELDILCHPVSEFEKSHKNTKIIQKGNAMMVYFFLHIAKNGESFMDESDINKYLRTDLNEIGCDKDKQPFYNIAKAYWTLKTLMFKLDAEAEDNIIILNKLLEELEITMSTFWFPSLGGRGYSHSERKENTKNAILPWNVFSNDELDLIFTQMPLYKQPSPSPSTSPSSACFIATAAFGSPIADEVIVLRNWRDQILMRTFIGQNFVKVYYKLSPPLADYIEKSILMKKFTIFVLYPFIKSLKKNN